MVVVSTNGPPNLILFAPVFTFSPLLTLGIPFCQVARPFASEVRTFPLPGFPPLILICSVKSN